MKFLAHADALMTARSGRKKTSLCRAVPKAEKIKMAKSRKRLFALETEAAEKYPFRRERRSLCLRRLFDRRW